MSNSSSIRFTASKASGEMIARCLPFFAPLFAEAAMSARTKNLRRACDQQSASVTGPGERPGAYSLLYPA